MTPEQFDLYMKEKSQELTMAWQAFPPTENEVIAKAIIDYQYKATVALMDAIREMHDINLKRTSVIIQKLDEIENRLKNDQ